MRLRRCRHDGKRVNTADNERHAIRAALRKLRFRTLFASVFATLHLMRLVVIAVSGLALIYGCRLHDATHIEMSSIESSGRVDPRKYDNQ